MKLPICVIFTLQSLVSCQLRYVRRKWDFTASFIADSTSYILVFVPFNWWNPTSYMSTSQPND